MTARGPVYVQLGLFGGTGTIEGTHLVAAHSRILADGTEVYVAEYRRWNRGRQAYVPAGMPRSPRPRDADQPGLFDRPPHVMEELEMWPGAWQLPLWPA
ncbi:MAG: hypothetical protein H6737_31910 [Alphaproteobacteria bacterium]|nr:hypothetical protein [Alphaproteobacteria bacterium]